MGVPPPGAAAAASSTHKPRWRALLFDPAGTLVDPSLPVMDGNVTKDINGTRLSVNIPTQPTPQPLDQYLLPGGSIAIQWRFEGVTEWATLAHCDVVSSAIARPEADWVLAGTDRGRRVALDHLGAGHDPGTGTIAAVITGLIHRTFPSATVEASGKATVMPYPATAEGVGGDPWALAKRLADTAGAMVYEDTSRRVFVIRDIPALASPVDDLAVGDGGCLTRYTLQHELGYNRAVIRWIDDQTQGLLRQGVAEDNRPDSPVAVSRIGTRITTYQSLTVTAGQQPGQADADNAAAALMAEGNQRMRTANLVHAQRPWLQPGDTIRATYLGGPTEDLIIDQVQVPLTTGEEQVTVARTNQYKITQIGA